MMPTFPRPSLKFRKAGFPRYGFKAGRSGGTFLSNAMSRVVQFASALRALRFPAPCPRSESRGAVRLCTSVQAAVAALPQGPSLRSGYSVPAHPHLLGPIRPTRKHISISPTRLIRGVLAVRRVSTPRRPTSGSVLSLAVLYRHVVLQDPGKPAGCSYPVLHRPHWPSTFSDGLGTSITLHPPILVEESISRLNHGSHALQPADLLAPLSEQTRLSPSLRGLLHPGFRRIGRPHRRRISLQWQLGKFHRRDLHPLERQLASLQPKIRPITIRAADQT